MPASLSPATVLLASSGFISIDAVLTTRFPQRFLCQRGQRQQVQSAESYVSNGLLISCSGLERVLSNFQHPSVYFRRSEEHTSELQSQSNLVCRLLLEKK